jgi:hypothetical protein
MVENENKIKINNIENEEDKDMTLEIGNLNINQEVDIKENPKKHIVNVKKKQILINSVEENNISENSNSKDKKIINISCDDIYLGNEMFFSAPRSYPGDYEKRNKFLTDFALMYNKKNTNNHNSIYSYISTSGKLCNTNHDSCNDDSNNLERISCNNNLSPNNMNNVSLAEEEECDDDDYALFHNNSFDNLDEKKESSHLKDFISSINHYRISTNIFSDEKNIYIDEDELKNENIFFIENETELNNLNYYSKKNKCNISYISLNLFIKEICTGNLRSKYPILYKSFINQYQEFLSIPSLIEKIIDAMNFYIKKMGIEIPDLISLLNKIISTQFKKFENDDELIEKITAVYKDIKQLKWIDDSLGKEIDNVNFILSSNNSDDFDVEFTKYLISDRRKSKAISIRSSAKLRTSINKAKNKNLYFNIFDFSDDEIAKNLTLISYKLLSCIDVNELWIGKFTKEDKYTKSPNVMKVIDRFDKLMLFIIEDICSYETNKARAKLITKWANIAKRCRDLHNYNDLLIINQCFNHNLLKKMVSTWKKLPKSTLELIADLNKFCSNQQCYINIRREIVGCKHIAYIPYLGILLKEIVDIENKDKYAEKFGEYNCINCVKLQKMYFLVNKFFEFRNYTFTFTQVNELNILNQINPKSREEIEEMIINNEKNKFTIKQLIQSSNKKKPTKTDQLFYC